MANEIKIELARLTPDRLKDYFDNKVEINISWGCRRFKTKNAEASASLREITEITREILDKHNVIGKQREEVLTSLVRLHERANGKMGCFSKILNFFISFFNNGCYNHTAVIQALNNVTEEKNKPTPSKSPEVTQHVAKEQTPSVKTKQPNPEPETVFPKKPETKVEMPKETAPSEPVLLGKKIIATLLKNFHDLEVFAKKVEAISMTEKSAILKEFPILEKVFNNDPGMNLDEFKNLEDPILIKFIAHLLLIKYTERFSQLQKEKFDALCQLYLIAAKKIGSEEAFKEAKQFLYNLGRDFSLNVSREFNVYLYLALGELYELSPEEKYQVGHNYSAAWMYEIPEKGQPRKLKLAAQALVNYSKKVANGSEQQKDVYRDLARGYARDEDFEQCKFWYDKLIEAGWSWGAIELGIFIVKNKGGDGKLLALEYFKKAMQLDVNKNGWEAMKGIRELAENDEAIKKEYVNLAITVEFFKEGYRKKLDYSERCHISESILHELLHTYLEDPKVREFIQSIYDDPATTPSRKLQIGLRFANEYIRKGEYKTAFEVCKFLLSLDGLFSDQKKECIECLFDIAKKIKKDSAKLDFCIEIYEYILVVDKNDEARVALMEIAKTFVDRDKFQAKRLYGIAADDRYLFSWYQGADRNFKIAKAELAKLERKPILVGKELIEKLLKDFQKLEVFAKEIAGLNEVETNALLKEFPILEKVFNNDPKINLETIKNLENPGLIKFIAHWLVLQYKKPVSQLPEGKFDDLPQLYVVAAKKIGTEEAYKEAKDFINSLFWDLDLRLKLKFQDCVQVAHNQLYELAPEGRKQ